MTNRETDGDIHGERAAEIHRLVGELRTQFENFERAWQMRGDGIDHLQSQLDACRPYLKEGETAADALKRLSAADEWRPIATAPAHGVRVLATWDNTWSKGGEHIEVCEAGERGEWFYSFDCDAPATEPTHWMPLPAAPTTTED